MSHRINPRATHSVVATERQRLLLQPREPRATHSVVATERQRLLLQPREPRATRSVVASERQRLLLQPRATRSVVASGSRDADRWLSPGAEPAVEELLADPVLHLVMRRDGVSLAELRAVIAAAQARRCERAPCPCPA